MELLWNGVDGTIESNGIRWKIATRPQLSFEFEDVYYAPKTRLVFKIVNGNRLDLEDNDVIEILKYINDAKPPEATLDEAISKKLGELAAKRYEVETGGISFMGSKIRTDRESQALLNAAFAGLQSGFSNSIDWKNAEGQFIQVTIEEMKPIAQAVFDHVQRCFSLENSHAASIRALKTPEDIDNYDLNLYWQ